MDCILSGDGKDAIYCSTELTTGKSAYKAMLDNNVHTIDELDDVDKKIFKRVKEGNKQAAAVFASKVRAEHKDGTMIINPAPLERPGWEQNEYYAFWDELIRTRVKQIRFNDEWEFSNGCTYELAVALDEDIPILDSKGDSLAPKNAITAIEDALQWLHHQGFDEALKKLRRHRDFCRQILERKETKVSMTLTPDLQRAGKRSARPPKGAKNSVGAAGPK